MILGAFENRSSSPIDGPLGRDISYGEAFNCGITAVGAATGLSGMVSNFVTLWNGGASLSTVLGIVKNIFRTYVGWFLVGWAVYEFGECLGLW